MSGMEGEMKLKPCPFCGGTNISIDTKLSDRPESGYGVTCLTDNCMGNIYIHDGYYPTKEDVIEAWNTRSNKSPRQSSHKCSEDCHHSSDCAVHNEPAYPNGECDCKEKKSDN